LACRIRNPKLDQFLLDSGTFWGAFETFWWGLEYGSESTEARARKREHGSERTEARARKQALPLRQEE